MNNETNISEYFRLDIIYSNGELEEKLLRADLFEEIRYTLEARNRTNGFFYIENLQGDGEFYFLAHIRKMHYWKASEKETNKWKKT